MSVNSKKSNSYRLNLQEQHITGKIQIKTKARSINSFRLCTMRSVYKIDTRYKYERKGKIKKPSLERELRPGSA